LKRRRPARAVVATVSREKRESVAARVKPIVPAIGPHRRGRLGWAEPIAMESVRSVAGKTTHRLIKRGEVATNLAR
jgi:hypothetical protein